jgi:hypothetical protein
MDTGGENEHSPAASSGSCAEPSGAAERQTVDTSSMSSALPKISPTGEGHESMLDVDGASTSTTGATSTCVPVRSSSRISEWRGCVGSSLSDRVVPSSEAACSAAANDSAGSQQSSEAQPQLTPAELRTELEERQALMFVVGSKAPATSGRRALLSFATKEAVQLGWETIRDRCKADRPELSRSFGNFDQRVGLGWLLGDVVCGFLIPFDDALAVGTKAVKAGPDLKAEFAAPGRRAAKARYTCTEERERALAAAATEEADLRRADAELPIPAALPPEKPAGAKRRRVEVEMPPPAPVPRPLLQMLKAAVARAEVASALAEGAFAAALRSAAHAKAAYENAHAKHRKAIHTGDPLSEGWEARVAALRKERDYRAQALCEDNWAIWQPERDSLQAKFVLSEARFDLREEERECARRAESQHAREAERAERARARDREAQELAEEREAQAARINTAHRVFRFRHGWCDSPSTDCPIRGNCTRCE